MLSSKSNVVSGDEAVIKSQSMNESLNGRTILITGAAKRVGKIFASACARAGADVVIHHAHSDEEAEIVRAEIAGLGHKAWVFKADLNDSSRAQSLIPRINESAPLHGFVNSAAIFQSLSLENTSLEDWEKHLAIDLTAPFLLSQAFAKQAQEGAWIVNILDWRLVRSCPYRMAKPNQTLQRIFPQDDERRKMKLSKHFFLY
ncbi:MAG TPA: SDR family NAD(P)-dependent oxidoreductase [Anaerolineales bacterium]|nr:SDR family NAD(P)-dependent oxidoreductase [Anaerolineales bacterium]